MRAIIADGNRARRAELRRTLLNSDCFELCGEADTADGCAALVAGELPEVLICSASCRPALLDSQAFPVVISIADAAAPASPRVISELPLPLEEDALCEALSAAASRTLAIKVNELCHLVRAYTEHQRRAGASLEKIRVEQENGTQLALSTDDVLWIKAAGNYVRLHTAQGVFEFRETISNLALRLEPAGFTRIHRGFVVNNLAVRERVVRDGRVQSLVLRDGTPLQVGPNFRDSLPPLAADMPAFVSPVLPADRSH